MRQLKSRFDERRGRPEFSPPKSIEELAREQGLTGPAPDYIALASEIWRTEEEVREFGRFVKSIRRPSRR